MSRLEQRKEGRKKEEKIMRDGLRTGRFTIEGDAAGWRHKTKQRRKAKREKYITRQLTLLRRFMKRRSGVIMN